MHDNNLPSRTPFTLIVAVCLLVAGIVALGCSSTEPPASSATAEESVRYDEPRTVETEPRFDPPIPPSVPSSPPSGVNQQELQQRMLEALMLEAARQQQQQQQPPHNPEYENFRRSVEQARICPHCGGAGSYRYVDAAGMLQVRQCPSCMGTGRAY